MDEITEMLDQLVGKYGYIELVKWEGGEWLLRDTTDEGLGKNRLDKHGESVTELVRSSLASSGGQRD